MNLNYANEAVRRRIFGSTPKKLVDIIDVQQLRKDPHSYMRSFSTAYSSPRHLFTVDPWRAYVYNKNFRRTCSPMAAKRSSAGQILLFPSAGEDLLANPRASVEIPANRKHTACQVVLSGSYRRDSDGLRRTYEELLDLGCHVLSPTNVDPAKETEGFVFMRGEETDLPGAIEARHLDAIERAAFVWLHAPEGYVGTSAALEVGFANAAGVPVFARQPVADPVLSSFVRVISSPQDVIHDVSTGALPVPAPGVRAFQSYYRRIATQRGYENENAQDCLTLMVEEVGELARAIRRRRKLTRHGAPLIDADEARELADVFLYVVHMANVLDIDLSRVVQAKEVSNLRRFLGSDS